MKHDIHMGSLPSSIHEMHQKRRDNACIHLMHDYGNSGSQFLFKNYNQGDLIHGILQQQARMEIDGELFDVNGHLAGKIDLSKLGVSAEHIAHVEELKATAVGGGLFAARFAPPPASHAAGRDENVNDFPGGKGCTGR